MSDFAINGIINVDTNADKALAEFRRLEQELKAAHGRKVHQIIDDEALDRVKKHVDKGTFRELGKEIRRTEIGSRLAANGIKGFDDSLVDALHSAEKFNRVSRNMIDNFRGGNFGDPKDLQYFRELARSADGLNDMRRALSAAEITGATVPQSLRQVVREADKFEDSFGRAVQSMRDFDSVNATRGMDELTRAMVRYDEATARRDQANRDAGNDALPHHQRKAAADAIKRYNKEILDAERDFIRESDRLDTESGRKREKADRDEMARRKANAQAQAMLARDEIAANKARVAAENAAITERARGRAFEAREEAAARNAREKFLAQDRAYHEGISNLRRDFGYAEMAETASQEAVSRTRLADATRDATQAQTAYNAARAKGDEDGMLRAHKLHTAAVQREVTARNDLSRAIQFQNGIASQNRYAMYDMARTYGIAAAIPTAGILGTGIAAGWWESQMTAIARTAGLDTLSDSLPGGGGRSRTLTATEEMAILERQMMRMGDVIPSWLGNITEIAKVGGQLGVHAKDLSAFTGVIAQFQAVSDVTDTNEIAEAFGRIGSLRGTQDFRMIADAIANVGVNSAATDAQIIKTTQEIAQAGAGANFTTQQLVGMAGGFASLAVPPERARSVLQQFVQVATRGLAGSSDSMQKFAGYMGVTEDAAKSLFRTDPAKFMVDFSKALAGMSPEEIVSALNDVGLSGQRAAPVFQALAKDAREAGTGMGVFETAIHDAVNSSGALTAQFAPIMDDLASSWQRFLNTFVSTSAVTGSGIAPILGNMLDGMSSFMRDWRDVASTDIGKLVIGGGSIVGTGLALGFGGRAVMAGLTGMALAITSVSKAAGGSFTGQLRTIGSALLPSVFVNSGKATTALNANARGWTGVGAGAAVAANRVGAANAEIGRSATSVSRATAGFGRLGSVLMGIAGGPLGVTALGVAGAAIGAEVMSNHGRKSVTEMSQLLIAATNDAEKNSTAFTDVILESFNPTTTSQLGTAMQDSLWNIIPPLGALRSALNLTGNDIRGMADSEEFFRLGLESQGKSWWTTTAQARDAASRVSDLGNSIGNVAATDLPMAQRMMSKLKSSMGLTSDEIYSMVENNGALKESFLDAANAANVQVGSLDTVADRTNFLTFLLGETSVANDGAEIAGIDAVTDGLTNQVAARMEDLQALNASTQAAGSYFTAMEGIEGVMSDFHETYGAVTDLWDQSTGMWNITNADTAALALSFEDLAANALSMAGVFADMGNFEAANNIIGDAREKVRGLLTELTDLGDVEIDQILAGLNLLDDMNPVIEMDIRSPDGGTLSTIKNSIDEVIAGLAVMPEGATVTVTALTDEAVAQIQAAGYHVEELASGEYIIRTSVKGDARDSLKVLKDALLELEEGSEIVIENPSDEILKWLETVGLELEKLTDGTYVITVTEEYTSNRPDPYDPTPPDGHPAGRQPPVGSDGVDPYVPTPVGDMEGVFDSVIPIIEGWESDWGGFTIGQYDKGSQEITMWIDADVQEAIAAIDGVHVYIDSETGEVTVVADDYEAYKKLEALLEFLQSIPRSADIDFNLNADPTSAERAIQRVTDTPRKVLMSMDLDPTPAERAIQRVETSDRTTTIRAIADDGQAESDLTTTARPRPVTITATALVAVAEALLNITARNRPTTISVSVSGGAAADGYLNSIARDRTSTITVNTNHNTHYTSSGSSAPPSGSKQPPRVDGSGADGGYAGAGPKWALAGVYHAGEYIIPKRDVDQTTGLPRADALARLMGQDGAMGGPQVIVQQGSGGGIMELGPTSIHAIARAVQPMLKMDSTVIAQGVSSQFANNTRKGAY